MKKDIADKWIDALESGEYKQAANRLKSDNGGMCCLGVLCEISGLGGWSDGGAYVVGKELFSFASPPNAVRKWVGLKSEFGRLPQDIAGFQFLSDLNDRAGYTFTQIAQVIRENWEEL